jgi:uncharacterized protein
MEQRLTMVGLGVSDLKTSAEFYDNIFGWQRMEASNEHIIFYQLPGGVMLSLYGRKALAEDATVNHRGNGFKGFTLAYNTRSENEVDEIIEELRTKGVKIVKEPQKVFWGGYSSYIADPDDNLWEIAFNPYMIPE